MAGNDWNFYNPNATMENMNFGLGSVSGTGTPTNLNDMKVTSDLSFTESPLMNNGLFNTPTGGAPTPAAGGTSWWDSFTGYTDQDKVKHAGWGSLAFDLLKSGTGFYLGSQQMKQAEDALAENKRQFDLNFSAQKELVNDQLRFQHQARTDRMGDNYTGELTQI